MIEGWKQNVSTFRRPRRNSGNCSLKLGSKLAMLLQLAEKRMSGDALCTYYYWKPRFDKDGYAGLESYEKLGVPVGTGRVAAGIQTQVVELHRAHADWGKRRLSDEMAKANNWVALVSPNSVRRILLEAGLWKPEAKQGKKVRSRR
jgi:hypothetical protein